MKTIFCFLICVLSVICPSKALKDYCGKLADKVYVISEPNEGGKMSVAAQVLSDDIK